MGITGLSNSNHDPTLTLTLRITVKIYVSSTGNVPPSTELREDQSSSFSVKVKVRTLDIAPLCESSPQKRSGMARVLKGSHSFTCTPTRSSAMGMSHTCLCLPSYSCNPAN